MAAVRKMLANAVFILVLLALATVTIRAADDLYQRWLSPDETFSVTSPLVVSRPVYVRGDAVIALAVQFVREGGDVEIRSQLVDVSRQLQYPLATRTVKTDSGATKTWLQLGVIPDDVPSGEYVIAGTSTVQSRIGVHVARWVTTPFLIMPKGDR